MKVQVTQIAGAVKTWDVVATMTEYRENVSPPKQSMGHFPTIMSHLNQSLLSPADYMQLRPHGLGRSISGASKRVPHLKKFTKSKTSVASQSTSADMGVGREQWSTVSPRKNKILRLCRGGVGGISEAFLTSLVGLCRRAQETVIMWRAL